MNVHFDGAVGPYERVVWATDAASGLRTVVAVHSTALGPAIGGVRFLPYPDDALAMVDALRLAEGMTLKAAAAGLALGGGKSVIIGDPRASSPSLLRAFGRVVDRFDGAYQAAEDVGTTPGDMEIIRSTTPHVLGLAADCGDPSPWTALGVFAAIRTVREWTGDTVAGCSVVVQGVGKVGASLARRLAESGANVTVCDLDEQRAATLAREIGGRHVAASAGPTLPCDVFAPCALGGVATASLVPELRCRWIIGSANNQLVDDAVADVLEDAGIGYVPDFVANAGGLIAVAEGRHGWNPDLIRAGVLAIGDTVRALLEERRVSGGTLLAHARARAGRRIAAATVDARPGIARVAA